jgi:tripartite-type tricarboxylate transporter receptor subunit TctC
MFGHSCRIMAISAAYASRVTGPTARLAVRSPVKARLADIGLEPLANSPAEFGNYIVQYTEKWGKVIRAANIKAE